MRLDGRLLSVALTALVLVAGVAMAEEPVKEQAPAEATQSEKQTEAAKTEAEKAAQAKADEAAKAAEAGKAQAEKTAEAAKAEGEKKTQAAKAEGEKKAQAAKAQAQEKAQAAKAEGEKKAQAAKAQAGEMTDATAAQPGKAKQSAKAPDEKAAAQSKAPAAGEKKMSKASRAGGMAVAEIAVCETVQERAPVGASDSFSSGIGQLSCFTRVQNAQPPTQIFHRWYVGDQLVDEIAINVKGHHWRCWSTKTIYPGWTGECRVEILTEEGDVISTKDFVLES